MPKRKLVLEENDGSVIIGIMQPGSDPMVTTFEGAIEEALANVPAVLVQAEEKWAESPKNPAHKPPKAPPKARTTPAAAAAPATTPAAAADLPLLANTGDAPAAEGAEALAEETAAEAATEPVTEPVTEAVTEPEAEPAAEAEAESTEAATEAVTEAVTEAATEPATEAPDAMADAVNNAALEADQMERDRDAAAEVTVAPAEPAAEPPAPAARAATPSAGGWEYTLNDGRGPFADIQAAMDELGIDRENRPHHNRWDRLSTQLKEQIPRRQKES